MWERAGIPVEFTVLKHMLADVKAKFDADEYYHIGDTDMDKHYAGIAGFSFVQVQTMDREPWMGEIPWGPLGRKPMADPAPRKPSAPPGESW